ncbi:tyrosinase family protein [Streptomyces sp. NPDC001584]|uniref:tyrosinase family protein n=1 Tax=Streptomyces sp. NPDC001584 TaxID=3154521 RepID=UPI0033292514
MAGAGAAGAAQVAGTRPAAAAAAAAAEVVTRQEVRSLTRDQWDRFAAAVRALNARSGIGPTRYAQFSATHYNFRGQSHGVAAFLPWHREHLRRFEAALRDIDPSVNLPYWDWTIDYKAPEKSPVLSPDYFGGNGTGVDRCVRDGAFANWQVSVPTRHCLQRRYSGGTTIGSWYSPGMLENLLNTSRQSYDQFRRAIEGTPHASVHVNIGGDMSQMYSTNDPLDWVNHAFIDLIWAEWQARNPTLGSSYGGGGARPSNILIPFNRTVASTLDTRALGYTYPRWSGGPA